MGRASSRGGLQGWAAGLLLLSVAVLVAAALPTVSLLDVCGRTLQGDGMVLLSHGDSRQYYFVTAGTDCQLTLQAASPRDRVQFHFRFFLVHSAWLGPASPSKELRAPGSSAPGPCPGGSYVQFYDGRGQAAEPLGTPLCGTTIPLPVLSSGSLLTVRLVTRGQQPRVDFVGDITSVRTGLSASACSLEGYFPCRHGMCIPRSLVCSGSRVESCGAPPAWCKDSATRPPLLPLRAEASSTVRALRSPATRPGAQESRLLPPGTAPRGREGGRLLLLLASLAGTVGAALLCCCCCPGRLVWRLGVRRCLPASPLCTCTCARREPARVTPLGSSGDARVTHPQTSYDWQPKDLRKQAGTIPEAGAGPLERPAVDG